MRRRKLKLNKETVRMLSTHSLRQVVGGADAVIEDLPWSEGHPLCIPRTWTCDSCGPDWSCLTGCGRC